MLNRCNHWTILRNFMQKRLYALSVYELQTNLAMLQCSYFCCNSTVCVSLSLSCSIFFISDESFQRQFFCVKMFFWLKIIIPLLFDGSLCGALDFIMFVAADPFAKLIFIFCIFFRVCWLHVNGLGCIFCAKVIRRDTLCLNMRLCIHCILSTGNSGIRKTEGSWLYLKVK